MTQVGAPSATLLAELRGVVGVSGATDDPAEISRVLRDNSWLSPVLTAQLDELKRTLGPNLGVTALASPSSEQELLGVVEIAVRYRVPLSPRGAGSSNFGQVTPVRGAILLDIRPLKGVCAMDAGGGTAISAGAGRLQGELERAARAHERELTILTTTYDSATIAGWVAGGHVGLGSSMYGSIWDGNVAALRVVSATDTPRVLELQGAEVEPLLHTFGCAGIISQVSMATAPKRTWLEAVATFADFQHACDFVSRASVDPRWHHRALAAQEADIMPAFRPFVGQIAAGPGVLMLIDEQQLADYQRLAADLGGAFTVWQRWGEDARPSIAAMVYGHRMLWVKRLLPDSAFVHLYFDPDDPAPGMRAIKDRFGDEVLLEMKYVRSRWLRQVYGFPQPEKEGTLPAVLATLRHGTAPGAIDAVLRFCEAAGIPYQNPHTNVLEDTGLFPDVHKLVSFKASVDPYNLCNPDKLRSAEAISK